jgi:DNA-binding CsgD family transcriptional regulator
VKLTRQEHSALSYASYGLTRRRIAVAMGLQPSTVRDHLRSARYRLCARTITQAVAEAIRQGLIT